MVTRGAVELDGVDVRDEPGPAVLFGAELIVVPRLVVIDSPLINEVVEIPQDGLAGSHPQELDRPFCETRAYQLRMELIEEWTGKRTR